MNSTISDLNPHKSRFDLMNIGGLKNRPLVNMKQSGIRLKRVPNGTITKDIRRGDYHRSLKVGDWAIIDNASGRLFCEIKKVNPRSLLVEKEILDSGKIKRFTFLIKTISGAIIVKSQ